MITLSEKAIKEVKKIMEEQKMPEGTLLRVGVTGGGCAGFQYSLAFDENDKYEEANDDLYDFEGLKVVVDRKSDLYLDGTTVDFNDGLNQRGFTFNNPQATKGCGCGHSFSTY